MRKTALLLFLSLLSFSAFSLDRKVVIKEAPFIPCVEFNLTVINPSRLSDQISGVKQGEMVHLLAWDKRGQNILVELADGSRGYMPALAFVKGGVVWTVTQDGYKAAPTPSRDKDYGQLRYYLALPKATYKIVDAGFWSILDTGLQPYFMNLVDTKSGNKYTVLNKFDNPSYRDIRFKDYSDADMMSLPEEKPLEKTLFLDDGKEHSIGAFIGYTEEEIIAILGEPDARIAASRSRKNKTELFFRNVCYDGSTWEKKGYYNRGVVFYMSEGKVAEASIDSYYTGPKKAVKTSRLPAGTYKMADVKPASKTNRQRKTLPEIDWSKVTAWNFLYHVLHDRVSTNFIIIAIVIALLNAIVCLLWWLFVKNLLNFGPDWLVGMMYLTPLVAFAAYLLYTLWQFSWIYAVLIGLYSVIVVGGLLTHFLLTSGLAGRCETCHRYNDFEELERVPTERKLDKEPKPYGKEYLVRTSYSEFNNGSGDYSAVSKEYNKKSHVDYRQYYDVLQKCRKCGTTRHITTSVLIETLPGPIVYIRKVEKTEHWEEDEVTYTANISESGSLYNEREVSRTTRSRSRYAGGYDFSDIDADAYNIYLHRYLNGDKRALEEYYEERLGKVRH